MNPRYLAYCQAHGKTPEEMLTHDIKRFPGGRMCGFILWNSEKVRQFASQWGHTTLSEVSLALLDEGKNRDVHAVYNQWLQKQITSFQKGTLT